MLNQPAVQPNSQPLTQGLHRRPTNPFLLNMYKNGTRISGVVIGDSGLVTYLPETPKTDQIESGKNAGSLNKQGILMSLDLVFKHIPRLTTLNKVASIYGINNPWTNVQDGRAIVTGISHPGEMADI